MSVASILNQKERSLITIGETENLAQAAQLLARYKIGAVVIAEPDGTLKGILSERDIVRALAEGGAAALEAQVGAHMTRRVITCVADTSVNQVMEVMSTGKFRHVPVLRDGKLEAMISIGDVVKFRLAQLEHESASLRQYIAAG